MGIFILSIIILLFLLGTGSILLSIKFDKPIVISQKIHPMHQKPAKIDDLDVIVSNWDLDNS